MRRYRRDGRADWPGPGRRWGGVPPARRPLPARAAAGRRCRRRRDAV